MTVPDPYAQPPARPGAAASGPARGPGGAGAPARVTASTAPYATRPTRRTVFLRTFLPWQLWRFLRINLKMIRIIHRTRT